MVGRPTPPQRPPMWANFEKTSINSSAFSFRLLRAPRGEGIGHARLDVGPEQLLAQPVERRASRRHLEQHVHAVAILVDHPLDAGHLAPDPADPLSSLVANFRLHAGIIYPVGV